MNLREKLLVQKTNIHLNLQVIAAPEFYLLGSLRVPPWGAPRSRPAHGCLSDVGVILKAQIKML